VQFTLILSQNDPATLDLSAGPGLVGVACSQALALEQLPGAQSLAAAAASWSNLNVPGSPGVPMSTFAFAPTFTAGFVDVSGGVQALPSNLANDGINTVTMWEPAATFAAVGGPLAIGLTVRSLIPGTSTIRDADIAFQAAPVVLGGRPGFSFVENTTAGTVAGRTSATDPLYQSLPGSTTTPVLGFVDLQGVAAHQFGHAAGLGHSLLDGTSIPTASTSPTMFPLAQVVSPYISTAVAVTGPCSNPTGGFQTNTINAAATPPGGLIGQSGRTLEPDDQAALARAYPALNFSVNLGGIIGVVRDAAGNPVLGAHVIAIDTANPDVNRYSTFSYDAGVYLLIGLPPGTYYIQVEPVARNANGTARDYFTGFSLPNYFPSCLSGIPPTFFVPEFWNTGDAAIEGAAQADPITVVPTASIGGYAGANLVVDTTSIAPLQVAALAGPGGPVVGTPSSRGLLVPSVAATPAVGFIANGGPANANGACVLLLDLIRQTNSTANLLPNLPPQLLVTQLPAGGLLPVVQVAGCDAAGQAQFSLPTAPFMAYYNVFAQAGFSDGTLTNSVNVLFATP